MSVKAFPDLTGGGGGGGSLDFPLIAPTPGAAGSEPFAFATGGGLHGSSAGGVALSVANAGDALTLSAQGAATFAFALEVMGLATLTGGTSTPTLSAGTITTSGNANIGGSLGVAGSVQVTGDLAARSIIASADISAASVNSTGALTGMSLSITGAATLGSLSVRGTFRADQIESEGALLFPVSSPDLPGLALGEQTSTGVFATIGSLGLSVAGQSVLTFGSNRAANFPGQVTLPGLTATGVTTETLDVSGGTTLQSLAAVTIDTSGDVRVGEDLEVAGNLTVAGTSRLGDLRIDELSTDQDLTVGGATRLRGGLLVDGGTTLAQGLTVGGPTALANATTQRLQVAALYMLGGPPDYVPVRREPVPDQPTTIDYVLTLDPGGEMAISGALYVGKGVHLAGALLADGAATLASATIGGQLTVGGSATVVGELAVTQGIAAQASVIGGSAFTTGQGAPDGSVTGDVGDQYIDLASGYLYLKASGAGTSNGWLMVSTSASAVTYPLQAPATEPNEGPSYAFATSTGDGMGSGQAGSLYFTTAQIQAIYIDAQQNVTLSGYIQAPAGQFGELGVSNELSVNGQTSLAGLTAGDTSVQALTAASGRFTGPISATDATFDGVQTNVSVQAGGMVSATGDVTSAARLVGMSAVIGNATVSTGTTEPNGAVVGTQGDAYLDRTTGDLWLKTMGAGTDSGWAKVSTAASGTTFPLMAPDGSVVSPSYGFAQGGLGVTATGTGLLSGISGGLVGWTLDSNRKMTLAGALQVAGPTTLTALAATTVSASGALTAASLATSGSLTVTAASQLSSVTAGIVNAASLVSQAAVTAGTFLSAAGTSITPGTAKPSDAVGAQGDIAPTTNGAVPLYVRGPTTWRAVALVGDAAPTAFPLRGPADSAAAPNYSSAASPSTGIFAPAANQLGFATAGTQAGYIDAGQNWFINGALSGLTATFTNLTATGTLAVTGDTTLGGKLNVTGAVTLAATLSAGAISSSGALSAASATINGLLTAQSATTTGDVTIGGSLTVNGTTTQAGIQRVGYLQTGDGTISSPAWAFTSQQDLGVWRPTTNTLGFAAASANMLTLAPALATFTGALRVGGTNAGLASAAANTLQLQTGGNTALSIGSGGTSTFSFQAVFTAGSAASPAVAVGATNHGIYTETISSVVFPAIAHAGLPVATFGGGSIGGNPSWGIRLGNPGQFASLQGGIFAGASVPTGNFMAPGGAIWQQLGGGPGATLWVNEATTGTSATTWAKVLTSSSTIAPTSPIVGPAGTAAAPAFAAGLANTGIYSGTDAATVPFLGASQGGNAVTRWSATTAGGLPVFAQVLGNPTSATVGGGVIASAQLPATGAPTAYPGQLYQYLGGGAAQSLWVNEATGTTPSWAKVITTSSANSGVVFPLAANTAGSATTPTYNFNNTAGYTGTGMYAALETSSGSNIPVVSFASNGVGCGYVQSQSVSGQTLYQLFFGPVGGSVAGVRAGNLLPNGVLGAGSSQLFISSNGGAGTTLWVHEGTAVNTAWAAVITDSSNQSSLRLLQGGGPAAVPGVSRVSANTSNQIQATHPNSVNLVVQRPPSLVASTATTLTLADNGRIVAANLGGGPTVFTLPATVAGIDQQYTLVNNNTGSLTVRAPAGVIIYVGGLGQSTSGGTVSSSTSAASINLINMGGNNYWIASGAPAGTFTFA